MDTLQYIKWFKYYIVTHADIMLEADTSTLTLKTVSEVSPLVDSLLQLHGGDELSYVGWSLDCTKCGSPYLQRRHRALNNYIQSLVC